MNNLDRLATLNRIRTFSRLMDSAFRIPGTPFRIGWDPIIGLIPGLGDAIDTGISAYIILMAARFGLPRSVLGWMIFNVGLEAIVGSVPLVGDLFDAFFKSNIRNLVLLERHLQIADPELSEQDDLNLDSVSAIEEKVPVGAPR
ncbi:DUF4112 domain-containing protein [Leptolyngbya ohadii]|uniref:DUF4112 domain-containing protein n=1 Tax=Leptolyngbya ohadii TaxID=1962290 RepID=UPI000B599AAD|nr:DUF4112 domain-containing protein [Leptolyngbya ohadii]